MEKNYNIYRDRLHLPEYGRHIHQMVNNLLAIDDRTERNRKARVVIGVMGNLNAQLRDSPEYAHKLWDHLFIMSDFRLDVDSPYPIPTSQTLAPVPAKMPYPDGRVSMKHYGKYVSRVLNSMDDSYSPAAVQGVVSDIARFMRTKSFEYNQEHPNNEAIIKDIRRLSREGIDVDEQAIGMLKSDYRQGVTPPRQNNKAKKNGKAGKNNPRYR